VILGGGKTIVKDLFFSFISCLLLLVLVLILEAAKYLLLCQTLYQSRSTSFGLNVAGKSTNVNDKDIKFYTSERYKFKIKILIL